MNLKNSIPLLLAAALLLTACGEQSDDTTDAMTPADSAAVSPLVPSAEALATRVDEARRRLQATEGGQMILGAIDAQGGLEPWYNSGALVYRFAYRPLGDRPPNDTRQMVDTWRSRARHWLSEDENIQFGWDGQQAWTLPADADVGTNARFWALTPYYFVGIPWVLADPGVNHEPAGEMEFEGRTYDLVRATFDPGTGDAPDDYYIVLIDRQSGRVGGVRYIVTYFERDTPPTEKLMTYDGEQHAGRLVFPEAFRTYTWSDAGAGELVTETILTDVEFRNDIGDSVFVMPEGAGKYER